MSSERWILAARGELYALSIRLQWDFLNLMRVLWAINRQWDQDFKWIDQQSRYLPLKPQRLSERINTVFELSDPEQSIQTCFELILETLALVPPEIDVAAALANVQAALDHGPISLLP